MKEQKETIKPPKGQTSLDDFGIITTERKITYWKKLFRKVNDEIEVKKVVQKQKNVIVYYLMPYSEIENEFVFNLNSARQDVINGFCLDVKKRASEMIYMIQDCTNNLSNYFNYKRKKEKMSLIIAKLEFCGGDTL